MNSVPTFKQSNIFGIYTRKWIKVSLFLLIGYNIITLLTHFFVWSLPKIFRHHPGVGVKFNHVLSIVCCDKIGKGAFNQKYLVYVATGIKSSIIFILSMLMLLITWLVYFGNRLDRTPQDKGVLEFGTWTMVSILLCSFLWLIKSCVLLYWEAHSVYDRLHSKITAIGKQLYFLIMLSHTHYEKVIEFPEDDSNVFNCGSLCSKTAPKKKAQWVLLVTNSYDIEDGCSFDRKRVRAKLIDHLDPKLSSTFDLKRASELFLFAQYALSKESIVDDLHHLQHNYSEGNNLMFIETLRKIVQVKGEAYFTEDWQMLRELLPDVKTEEEITFQKVKTFMERTRNSCMFLTNTFISEREVVNCLDQVMGWIIIGAIFIMWLLVTGLASTTVLVLIASPALAASFIFGDTAKNLFQGLIFVYVVHPFDVGDLCIIDGELLEVNRISIWSTTFSNVRNFGEQYQVIYPNSDLAVKHITNYKTSFNWHDRIEFLCSPDKKITVPLEEKIVRYLNGKKERFAPNFHSVDILEIGDKAKIVVHVKHKLPETGGWTYFECLKAKEKRRFKLAIDLQNLVKELEFEAETPELVAEMKQEPARG
ncbi:mechanosensitive ion channel protein 9-like isoform X3 [Silene latifolia]